MVGRDRWARRGHSLGHFSAFLGLARMEHTKSHDSVTARISWQQPEQVERSGVYRRSILWLWADTIVCNEVTVAECNSLPSSTITPRSSITGAPGPGTN